MSPATKTSVTFLESIGFRVNHFAEVAAGHAFLTRSERHRPSLYAEVDSAGLVNGKSLERFLFSLTTNH